MRTIICVLMWMLFDDKPILGEVELTDLQRVCMFEFPFDFTFNSFPEKSLGFCSAAGSYKKHQPPPDLKISDINMALAFVYVYDITLYNLENKIIKFVDPLSFLEDIKREIVAKEVNVLILDFLERDFEVIIPLDIDNNIQLLYAELKQFKKELLIGLMLPKSKPNDLELRLKDLLVDLNDVFIVATYDYEECRYNEEQLKMAKPPTDVQIEDTIKMYQGMQFPLDKLIITIEVVVKSWKNKGAHFYEKWSYKYMCEAKPGPDRKYCLQDLKSIYLQTKVVQKFSLLGVIIKSIDFDDWNNTCRCTKFPVAQVINEVFFDNPEDTVLTGCTAFGQHK